MLTANRNVIANRLGSLPFVEIKQKRGTGSILKPIQVAKPNLLPKSEAVNGLLSTMPHIMFGFVGQVCQGSD